MKVKTEIPLIRQNSIDYPIKDEVTAFLTDRRARQLSESTIDFYSYHLDILLRYAKKQGIESMEAVTSDFLRGVLADFGTTHNKGGVHALYRSIKAFCNWFEQETEKERRNPILKVTAPKIKNDPIPGVTMDEVKRLGQICPDDWYGKRDRALFYFLFDTGVRAAECLALNLDNIDLETGTVQVINGKGDKDRVVYFGNETAIQLRRYLRGRSSDKGDSPLWLSRFGERMQFEALKNMINRRNKQAGIKTNPSAHDFRRGFALNMLRNGADLLTVSRLLGHVSLEITKRYLALLDEDLKRSHVYASPVHQMSVNEKKHGVR